MRSGTWNLLLNTVLLASLVYFSVDAWLGPSGGGHWSELRAGISEKAEQIGALEAEIAAIEGKIARLTGQEVDLELLDERLRTAYGLGREDEILLAPLD